MRRLQISPLWMAAALSAVAGMADSAGFILLDGLFIAHVTGNFVLIGAAVARGTTGIVSKILTLPAFFLGYIFFGIGRDIRRRFFMKKEDLENEDIPDDNF